MTEQEQKHLEVVSKYSQLMKTRCEQAKKIKHQVHGFQVYKCRQCGAIYLMWLEEGIFDQVKPGNKYLETWKPTPFAITCIECFENCEHILWGVGDSEEYTTKSDEANFFANTEEDDCGVPIIFKKDYDRLSTFVKDKGIKRNEINPPPKWDDFLSAIGISEQPKPVEFTKPNFKNSPGEIFGKGLPGLNTRR